MNAADCEEFRQVIIDTIVAKKIFKTEDMKELFDAAIAINTHLNSDTLTDVINEICKILVAPR